MIELKREISKLKAKRRKCKKILKEDLEFIKQIGKNFKHKTYKAAINRFERLYAKKKEMSEEIAETSEEKAEVKNDVKKEEAKTSNNIKI